MIPASDAATRVALAPVLDLSAATPLKAELEARLGVPVTLDAGEVRRLGGQCLQVLIAARRRWAADGLGFAVAAASPAFADALAAFGVGADLEPLPCA